MTGDDFGVSEAVNEAIEQANKNGILTTTSLMVGASAMDDAVARARRLPSLQVGLHIVLVRGQSVLAHNQIPDLVDREGNFSSHLVSAGVNYFFKSTVRRQLEAEIRAQFAAFRETGLPLDHVNAHNHYHMHPTVLGLIIKVGREFGLKAVRVPSEPFIQSWRAAHEGLWRRLITAMFLGPWAALVRWRLAQAGLQSNDHVFGLHDTGHMTPGHVLEVIANLPAGISEMYFHPATHKWPEMDPAMKGYQCEQELAALTSAEVMKALERSDIKKVSFSDLAAMRA